MLRPVLTLCFLIAGPAFAESHGAIQFEVGGMTCQGCAEGVQQKLEGLSFVEEATASFESGEACVELSAPLDEKALRKAVRRNGAFTITGLVPVAACPAGQEPRPAE